jgi:pyruvate formate lyase activating enzyme
MEERALRDLGQYVDAAHVDLKGFDEATYRQLNSGKLGPILTTLKTLKSLGIWFEIIHLLVPTYTDKPEMLRPMCDWICRNLGPGYPLHFSRFHPQHKLAQLPPTPVERLVQAKQIAQAAGLHYVYLGNVPGLAEAGTTFCPGCKMAVIERDIFTVTSFRLVQGSCPKCHTPIAGRWI